ncbi:MAG: glycosyltransferase [Alistipes sp.]
MNGKEIAAIIVTYNRLDLLKRCVEALKSQTYQNFDIIIINNGSSDGSKEWLDEQDDRIIAIHQDNVGGAGGFYSGQKYAFDNGYEWVWMMDDDGVADHKQLEELWSVAHKYNLKYLNALVCDIEHKDSLAFGFGAYTLVSETKGCEILPGGNPFNGTFAHRSVMENIGFVKKEMFIWGDENEYSNRAKVAGYPLTTVTSALHYHPRFRGTGFNVIPFINRYKVYMKPFGLSNIYYRNMGYIYHTYRSSKDIYKIKLLYSIYFLRTLKLREYAKFITYFNKGAKGDFSNS